MGKKSLGVTQLVMMALGTVIGGSFFLGSSVAIHAAGPSVLIGFVVGGALVYFILTALSEMTVANPDAGSFRTFAENAFGRGTGFVTGWVYWTGMVLAMSSEATAVSILVRNWIPGMPIAVLGSLVIAGVTLLNLLGADKLAKLESWLAAIKIFAIISFITVALLLMIGIFPGKANVSIRQLVEEPFMPSGITGLLGSMLIVMFTYAGFEVIGFASSEAANPQKTVPKAIRRTVISLVGLFLVYVFLLLMLIPTSDVSENTSPIVAALSRQGIGWAGQALNLVLITAILSTMLAALFGIGRMMRSLADEGLAPGWLRDKTDIPYRGIGASGAAMLLALGVGLLFPRVYLFLISSGGFAILFSYAVIVATHMRFRQKHGCPDESGCQVWGYPFTSIITLVSLIAIICSMPFVTGQSAGLVAGIAILFLFTAAYAVIKYLRHWKNAGRRFYKPGFSSEISNELTNMDLDDKNEDDGR